MSGSDQAAQNPWFRAKSRDLSGHRGSLEISGIITRCFVNAAVPQEPLLGPIGQGVMAADRKSTRLNSSHQIISYAVFCLKKKKQIVSRWDFHMILSLT